RLLLARRPSDLDRGPQPRRGRSRVAGRLPRAGPDRPARRRPQHRLLAADADRKVGRASAAVLLVAEETLDDPVLQRVEADHREPAARIQEVDRGRQRILERRQLVVHRDPERLEDPLRRMTVAESRRAGNRGLDRVDQLTRALERLVAPPADDRTRDLLRKALFAELPEDPDKLAFGCLIDELAGRIVRR